MELQLGLLKGTWVLMKTLEPREKILIQFSQCPPVRDSLMLLIDVSKSTVIVEKGGCRCASPNFIGRVSPVTRLRFGTRDKVLYVFL